MVRGLAIGGSVDRGGAMLRTRQVVLALIALLVLTVAWGPGPAQISLERPGQDGNVAGEAEHRQLVAQASQPEPDQQGVELRTTLEKLLGQHATLVVRFMRARLKADPDFVETAVAALDANTRELAEAVRSVYGLQAAEAFEQLWVDHTRSFFQYTVGLAEQDQAARDEAKAQLDRYREEFAVFIESATDGKLPAAAVADGLKTHIDLLLSQSDAYARADYAAAYESQREAYAHMFPTGRSLAGGFAAHRPGEFPVHFDEAPQQLRSSLGRLLGEHVELAVDAMRAGVTGAEDFEAATQALDANTREMTGAMDSLFGAEGARRFNTAWAEHIDSLIAYTAGLAGDDQRAMNRARARMDEFPPAFGAFLSEATGGKLPARAAAEALGLHDDQLVAQVEAYGKQDYQAAHALSYEAYQHMFATAAALASGIEGNVGSQLPVGGPQTGGGGTAVDSS